MSKKCKKLLDSNNRLEDSQQERKCSTSLESQNADNARDEGPIWAEKTATKQEQVVKN